MEKWVYACTTLVSLVADTIINSFGWEGCHWNGALSLLEVGTDPAPDTGIRSWWWGGACTGHGMFVGGVRYQQKGRRQDGESGDAMGEEGAVLCSHDNQLCH